MRPKRTKAARRGASRRGARKPLLTRPTIDARLVAKSVAMLLVTVVAALLVYNSGKLLERPVRQVSVQGDFRYLKQEEVKQAVAPYISNDYLTVPLGELRESLEALPWVYRAAVKRDWPDGLVIAVEEQTPIARWGDDLLINNKGALFSPAGAQVDQPLPLLEGPEGSQREVMERYIDMGGILASRGLDVRSLRMSTRGSWSTALESGVELVFGREKVVQKLKRFLAMYDHALVRYLPDIQRIDLRYQNGLAVQWRRKPGAGDE